MKPRKGKPPGTDQQGSLQSLGAQGQGLRAATLRCGIITPMPQPIFQVRKRKAAYLEQFQEDQMQGGRICDFEANLVYHSEFQISHSYTSETLSEKLKLQRGQCS